MHTPKKKKKEKATYHGDRSGKLSHTVPLTNLSLRHNFGDLLRQLCGERCTSEQDVPNVREIIVGCLRVFAEEHAERRHDTEQLKEEKNCELRKFLGKRDEGRTEGG
jgi:hypothetical protein